MNILNEFILSIIGLFMLSCGGSQDSEFDLNRCIEDNLVLNQQDETYVLFQNNFTKWKCLNISHYRFIHIGRLFSGCIDTKSLIEVKNNEIISIEILSPGSASHLCEFAYATIDEYFEIIGEAVDSMIQIDNPVIVDALGKTLETAYETSIVYDVEFGIPMSGFIDYIFGLADEEYRFEIRDFTKIE